MITLHIDDSNPIRYKDTNQFLTSGFAKGNKGLNNKPLKQNNTGLYFENIIYNDIKNLVVPVKEYRKLNDDLYIPDIETNKSIISCKCQETNGTAWQKIPFELLDLLHISTQTHKSVLLVMSDYSWRNYFYKTRSYMLYMSVNCPKGIVNVYTRSSFLKVKSII